jgi:hypothetical protein
MSKNEWWKNYDLPKPNILAGKDFLNAVENLLISKIYDERREALFREESDKNLEIYKEKYDKSKCDLVAYKEKYKKIEESTFNGLETIINDKNKVIGLKDNEGDEFYLKNNDPYSNHKISDIEDKCVSLKGENEKLKEINRKLNQEKNRARKRYDQAERSMRELTKSSGIKILTSIDDDDGEKEFGLPFDVPDIYTMNRGTIANIYLNKNKVWIHKTEHANASCAIIMVNGVDVSNQRKRKLELKFGDEILLTAGEPYHEGKLRLINTNVQVES